MFNTTGKQEDLRKRMRVFAEMEIKPISFQLDQSNRFPHNTLAQMGKLGFMGLPYPVEYGGAGLDNLSYAIAIEELAREDGGIASTVLSHASLAAYPIYMFGTEEQKQKYLTPLAKGDKLGAFALTETNAGSDAAGTQTTAVLDGPYYVINGHKLYTTNAPLADTYVITAVTTPDIGTKGISAFIVDKNTPGLTFSEPYDKMGLRSSRTADLNFKEMRIPKENLLGAEGQGFKIAMTTLDGGRVAIAAQALGIAQGAFEDALDYSKDRKQFEKTICSQQGVSFKLADMGMKIRAARLLVYSAASLKDNNDSFSTEAAMAKTFASEMCLEVVNNAMQIFGGTGYLKGLNVERAYRDAKSTTITGGTSEVQRKLIAAHFLGPLGKERIAKRKTKRMGETGERKGLLLDGSPEQQVETLLEALVADGYDFTVGIPMDTPVPEADRIISVGEGIGEHMALAEELAVQAGACMGATRPIVETLGYLPLSRYVGISGQKFNGNLYIACGISGSTQHLKGIKDATTIVAINNNPEARIFRNCDYGIIGDVAVILPLLAKAFDTGDPKLPAPPMVKMKKAAMKKAGRSYPLYICGGCGYEYDEEIGDEENDVHAGCSFDHLHDGWACPECSGDKAHFIEI